MALLERFPLDYLVLPFEELGSNIWGDDSWGHKLSFIFLISHLITGRYELRFCYRSRREANETKH